MNYEAPGNYGSTIVEKCCRLLKILRHNFKPIGDEHFYYPEKGEQEPAFNNHRFFV